MAYPFDLVKRGGPGGLAARPMNRGGRRRMDDVTLMLGDCLEKMAEIPDASVDLVLTDPPYHRVKSEGWDRQWKTDADYLDWIGRLCGEWRRVLKSNGSLYCFASPRMAARVECKIGETFEVLNSIVWNKIADYSPGDPRATAYRARDQGAFRRFFDYSERVIFAEHCGADGEAASESTNGFVFEPLRLYLEGERLAAGLSRKRIDDHLGTANVSQYWWQRRGFIIPTDEKYAALKDLAPGYFRREYEDLRREYEDLRREYEDLRRPFTVSADVPYTDVWDFPTVPHRPGKHPCAKPEAMLSHIIAASSRPGDTVLDSCMGSGTTGRAAGLLGRNFIGIEKDPKWFATAKRRIAAHQSSTPLLAGVS